MTGCDIDRIDHSVLYTTDMDATATTYEALGFTLTPLSIHLGSDRPGGERRPMGAGNRCALFGETYLELLGLFGDGSIDPWNIRPLIARYEGLHGCSFGCDDAGTVERRLREAGLSSSGVLPLQRDVETPGGVVTARFEAVHLDRALTPEGLIHIARHLTPKLIHQPRYLKHPNTATHLHSVLLVVDDAELEATVARYARTLGVRPVTERPRHVLPLRVGRMEIVAVSAFDEVLPGEPVPALPCLAGQAVAVGDVRAARALVAGNGFTVRELPGGFFVGAGEARGAAIAFVG
ncbi:VOC family protein [Nonomuraea rhodomycinica]|uniref:VOC family protein n=1 Tax=Nonomuraea rhodomycinica TaxID=1712872 RepID=A0A7Y6IT44_9ACTN|nr:VOC family protein [Nonomuraea rhodomycinica]NUW43618.1 VOC family protein [Nonomuraea rhodomycinica]